MDKFLEWIKNNQGHRAFIDKSHKNISTRENKAPLNELDNTELATYGDAVLKLALCEILWEENVAKLTEKKKKYESDEALVKYIAKHYEILRFLQIDNADENIPKGYDYPDKKGYLAPRKRDKEYEKDRAKYKYIATAIEACLGAMYMDENVSWNDIIEIVKSWGNIVDNHK